MVISFNVAIHSGELAKATYENYPVFNLQIPSSLSGVPAEVLNPQKSWLGTAATFNSSLNTLAGLFNKHFETYKDKATPDILAAQPHAS